MAHAFTTTRRVEFAETDLAGIAHFANFFRWMESAEHEFFRSLGLAVHGQLDGREFGFVRVHAECDYARPVHYGELVTIGLAVRQSSSKALAYEFEFRATAANAAANDEPVARGRLDVVHVTRPGGEGDRLRATDIPDEIVRRLDVAPRRDDEEPHARQSRNE